MTNTPTPDDKPYVAWVVERGSPAVYLNDISGSFVSDIEESTRHSCRENAEHSKQLFGLPDDRVCDHMFNCGMSPESCLPDKAGYVVTPRTDAVLDSARSGMYADGSDGVTAEEDVFPRLIALARQLERQIIHLKKELSDARDAMAKYLGERNELQRAIASIRIRGSNGYDGYHAVEHSAVCAKLDELLKSPTSAEGEG